MPPTPKTSIRRGSALSLAATTPQFPKTSLRAWFLGSGCRGHHRYAPNAENEHECSFSGFRPASVSGCHHPPIPENEPLCSVSGFRLSFGRHRYAPNAENEHECSFSGFCPVSGCHHPPIPGSEPSCLVNCSLTSCDTNVQQAGFANL